MTDVPIIWEDAPGNSVPRIRTATIAANAVPSALRSLADMLDADNWLDLVNLTIGCDDATEGFRVEAVLTDSYDEAHT